MGGMGKDGMEYKGNGREGNGRGAKEGKEKGTGRKGNGT